MISVSRIPYDGELVSVRILALTKKEAESMRNDIYAIAEKNGVVWLRDLACICDHARMFGPLAHSLLRWNEKDLDGYKINLVRLPEPEIDRDLVYEYAIVMPPIRDALDEGEDKKKEEPPKKPHEYDMRYETFTDCDYIRYKLTIYTDNLDVIQDIVDRATDRIMEAQMEEAKL